MPWFDAKLNIATGARTTPVLEISPPHKKPPFGTPEKTIGINWVHMSEHAVSLTSASNNAKFSEAGSNTAPSRLVKLQGKLADDPLLSGNRALSRTWVEGVYIFGPSVQELCPSLRLSTTCR